MRGQFFKLTLHFSNNSELPITVACTTAELLPELIEKNRVLYERTQAMTNKNQPIALERFSVQGVMPSLHMTEEKYQDELQFCDIVQEGLLNAIV